MTLITTPAWLINPGQFYLYPSLGISSHQVRHVGGGHQAEGGEQGGDGEAGRSDDFGQSFTAKNIPAVQGDEM